MAATHHVFGYGSLISSESRAHTGLSGPGAPVRVRGFARRWNYHSRRNRMTALGVVHDPASVCNGVVVGVDEQVLEAFDLREETHRPEGYERTEVSPDAIEWLGEGGERTKPAWIYVPKAPADPCVEFPIAQSYVDVVMSGCLEFGEAFAEEFVRTTSPWLPHVDDRAEPRYRRHMEHVPQAEVIDRLLRTHARG